MIESTQLLFDRISDFTPNNLEEYNSFISSLMKDLFDIFGIVKVRYDIVIPSEWTYLKLDENNTCVFEKDEVEEDEPGKDEAGNEEAGNEEPICLRYPYEKDGSILFTVHVQNRGTASDAFGREIKILFKQLSEILKSLILSSFCQKVLVTDSTMGMLNIKAFFTFGEKLIADGSIKDYTAIYFNIHNFRSVHKSLNYLESNEVLRKYCHIVSNALTEQEMVARLGGDNFMALVLDMNRDYFLDLIQNMIVKFEKDGTELRFVFNATSGASKLTGMQSMGEIMMQTGAAYQTARDKRVLLNYFDKRFNQALIEQKMILSRFGEAMKNKAFFPVFQPQVDVRTHAIIGAEALVRWREGGDSRMPMEFIPILEKDGCITTLDFFMLEETCKFIRRLLTEGIEPIKISVNFSKRHLTNHRLVEEIVEVVDRYEVPHQYIEIELTESEDYHNNSVMIGIVEDLKARGIKTSMDDFGTAYSSLAMLNALRVDELKIDRSFVPVNPVDDEDKSVLMLKGIVNLAKGLGLRIVVEGVETPSQFGLVRNLECDVVQGFLFDKPISEENLVQRIKQRKYESPG